MNEEEKVIRERLMKREEALAFQSTSIYREMVESTSELERMSFEVLLEPTSNEAAEAARRNIMASRLFHNWLDKIIAQGAEAEAVILNYREQEEYSGQ